jgi:hypothetical protein
MSEIVAANNLTIQFDSTRWSLYNGRSDEDSAIVNASADGLSYEPIFATARRLPSEGRLTVHQIAMVVVGWAVEDSSWHLGILLSPETAQQRGGRWCGFARWEDQDGDLAEQAGQALATVLNIPFRLVPPPDRPIISETPIRHGDTAITFTQTNAASRDLPAAQPIAVMPLPIDMGDWLLREDQQELIFAHPRAWYRALLMRILFFCILVPIFGLLSVGALLSPYAPAQPEWLPLAGLGISVLLLIGLFLQLRGYLRGPITLVDRRARLLRQVTRTGRRVLVQSPFEGLQYVLVSHVINRRKAQGTDGYGALYAFSGEVWIHAYSPRRGFIEISHVTDIEGQMRGEVTFGSNHPLSLTEINSPAHHAAVVLAREIGIPVYAEAR